MMTLAIVQNAIKVQYLKKKRRTKMKNKQFYFLLGFMTAVLFAMVISCSVAPLGASSDACGESSWNHCYVKIVD